MKIVDLHADIGYDVWHKRKAGEKNVLKTYHVPKWKKGNFDTVCMASFFDGHESWEEMKEMIITLKEEIATCDDIQLVSSKEDFDVPKIKAVLTVEGMCGIQENEEDCIDWLHEQGVIIASLTWNDENYLATGVKGNATRGLSKAGLRAIKRMEAHHMIIDVSHANEKTFWDIIEHTNGMVIATHSNCKQLCNHARNLNDDQIKAIAKRGGIIGAVAAPWFVDERVENRDVAHLVMHQLYLKKCIGIQHIAFGFDFMDFFDDYDSSFVKGLEDASHAQNCIYELSQSKIIDEDLEKIAYKNAILILKNAIN